MSVRRSFDNKQGIVATGIEFWKNINNPKEQEKSTSFRKNTKFSSVSQNMDNESGSFARVMGVTEHHHIGKLENGRKVRGFMENQLKKDNHSHNIEVNKKNEKVVSHKKVFITKKVYDNSDSSSVAMAMGASSTTSNTHKTADSHRPSHILQRESLATNTSVAETFGSPNRHKFQSTRPSSANTIFKEIFQTGNESFASLYNKETVETKSPVKEKHNRMHTILSEFNQFSVAEALNGDATPTSPVKSPMVGEDIRFNRSSSIIGEYNKVNVAEALSGDGQLTSSPKKKMHHNRSSSLLNEHNQVTVAQALLGNELPIASTNSPKAAAKFNKVHALTKKNPVIVSKDDGHVFKSSPFFKAHTIQNEFNKVTMAEALGSSSFDNSLTTHDTAASIATTASEGMKRSVSTPRTGIEPSSKPTNKKKTFHKSQQLYRPSTESEEIFKKSDVKLSLVLPSSTNDGVASSPAVKSVHKDGSYKKVLPKDSKMDKSVATALNASNFSPVQSVEVHSSPSPAGNRSGGNTPNKSRYPKPQTLTNQFTRSPTLAI